MKSIFKNKKISAIVSVVPKEEYRFDDEYPDLQAHRGQGQAVQENDEPGPAPHRAAGSVLFGPLPVWSAATAEGGHVEKGGNWRAGVCVANAGLLHAAHQQRDPRQTGFGPRRGLSRHQSRLHGFSPWADAGVSAAGNLGAAQGGPVERRHLQQADGQMQPHFLSADRRCRFGDGHRTVRGGKSHLHGLEE